MTIAIEHSGFTSMGTSTSKTLMGGANIILPAWAKSILAVIPQCTIDVPTVSQSVIPLCELESDDVQVNPYQVLGAPIAACLGATVGSLVAKPEKWAVGCPVNGGEQIRAYMTALVANTAAPYGGVSIVISDRSAGHAQRHAKVGTLTSSGTSAASDVAGTRYNFSAANRIVELQGILAPATVAAADALMGYFKFSSNEFRQTVPLKLPITPTSGGLSTIFSNLIDGVSRAPVDVPVSPVQVNIQDYLYMGLAPAANGNFITGVVYE